MSSDDAKGVVDDLSAEEEEARLVFRIAAKLRRDGDTIGAERNFERANALAPNDWTVRRASQPLRGVNPFGDAFMEIYRVTLSASHVSPRSSRTPLRLQHIGNSRRGSASSETRPSWSAQQASVGHRRRLRSKNWPNSECERFSESARPAQSNPIRILETSSSLQVLFVSTGRACISHRWSSPLSPTSSAPLHWSRQLAPPAPTFMSASLRQATPFIRAKSGTTRHRGA